VQLIAEKEILVVLRHLFIVV